MPLVLFTFVEKFSHNLRLALRSLWLHKMRTFLSVSGIIIGTGAVIALMAFGEGSMQDALNDIKRMGATNIIIRSVKPVEEGSGDSSFFVKYGLTHDDYQRFKNISTVIEHVPLRIFPQQIRHLGLLHKKGRVVGTTGEYAHVHKFKLSAGRFLNHDDNQLMKNHCVIGYRVAQKLFPLESPLGKTVTIKKNMYRVVGVMDYRMPTGGTGGSLAAEDFNDDMYIPLNTCNRRFGTKIYMRSAGSRSGEEVALHQITLTVDHMDHVRETGRIVEDLLKRYHKKQPDYAVTIPLDRLEQAENTKRRMQGLLAAIASISLVVGGIGIMNIMLATVTERTREIGIRRSLGAKRRDITAQFLIEAIAQTSIGGVLGVVFGLGAIFLVPPVYELIMDEPLPAKIHVPAIFIAFSFAVIVGVAFGWYPARKAARLDPIEALRHV